MKPVVVCVLALAICAEKARGVSITGTVRDGLSNALGGARVTLFTREFNYFEEERTTADGTFQFSYVAEGGYRLGVAALRYEYQEVVVTISNQNVNLPFTLGPETNGGRWSIVGSTSPELLDGTGSGNLLPSGDVFFCHDTQDPIMFEALSALRWYPPNSGSAQGCHMVTLNSDGGMFLVGGSMGGNPQDPVVKIAKTYWRNTNNWVRNADMIAGRWYPGLVRLADERLLVMGGELNDTGYGRTNGCELYNPKLNSWTPTGPFNLPTEIAPAVLLYSGEVLKTWRYPEIYNPATGVWRPAPNMIQGRVGASFGDHCDHEIVHLEDGRVMAVGVFPLVTNANTRFVEFYNPSNNTWSLGPNPRALRNRPEALILADGRVLSFGGQYSGPSPAPVPLANAGTIPNCTKVADLYDPGLNAWRAMADMNRHIHYHNVAVMVPDGRVIATGGAGLTANRSFAGDDDRIEAFEPPYLFRGVRPRIDELSTTDLVIGSDFTVRVSLTDAITKLVLVSARATTHWVDGGPQRYLSLNFSQTGSEVMATVPNDPIKALAGWYILFALVDDIPSLGRMVRITPGSALKQTLPTITAIVTDGMLSEAGPDSGAIRLTRSGPTSAPLIVPFTIGGTAGNPQDYGLISNFVTIAEGASSAMVGFGPWNDVLSEGVETASITLSDTAWFYARTNVTLNIQDNDPAPPPLRLGISKSDQTDYRLTVAGPASRMAALEQSSDLRNWSHLSRMWTSNGVNRLHESFRAGESNRFFRARLE